jgi:hypothetical protein
LVINIYALQRFALQAICNVTGCDRVAFDGRTELSHAEAFQPALIRENAPIHIADRLFGSTSAWIT